jgi:hypothetical protein
MPACSLPSQRLVTEGDCANIFPEQKLKNKTKIKRMQIFMQKYTNCSFYIGGKSRKKLIILDSNGLNSGVSNRIKAF